MLAGALSGAGSLMLLATAPTPALADTAAADNVAFVCAAIRAEQKVASQARELGMTVQEWQVFRCAAEAAEAGIGADELSAALSRLGARQQRAKLDQDAVKPLEPVPSTAAPAPPAAPAAPVPPRAAGRGPTEIPLGCAGRMTRDGCQPR